MDLRGARWTRPPPTRSPNSFNFMQFWGKFGKIICWRPPPRVGSPTSGKSIGGCFGSNPSGRSKGLGCPPRTPPLWSKFFSISYIYFGKFGKIVCWCPLMEGRRPLLRGILEPLLNPTGGFFLVSGIFRYDLEEPLLIFPI